MSEGLWPAIRPFAVLLFGVVAAAASIYGWIEHQRQEVGPAVDAPTELLDGMLPPFQVLDLRWLVDEEPRSVEYFMADLELESAIFDLLDEVRDSGSWRSVSTRQLFQLTVNGARTSMRVSEDGFVLITQASDDAWYRGPIWLVPVDRESHALKSVLDQSLAIMPWGTRE